MVVSWSHAAPSIVASFLASLVEFVEALTVVLAVGSVRGWRSAIAGTATAIAVLVLLVVVLGSTLTRIPLDDIQLVVGTLLLLFGLRWLRKAILRSAGIVPLHDEAAAYAKQTAAMRRLDSRGGWDGIAFSTAFQITTLEGIEVVFIVIAIAAGGVGLMVPASLGALAAFVLVVVLGLILHRPLVDVPENALKFVVGVLLSALGTFWVGEGFGLAWPGADWSILALIIGYLATALAAVSLSRVRRDRQTVVQR